jgi:hypothetical protein
MSTDPIARPTAKQACAVFAIYKCLLSLIPSTPKTIGCSPAFLRWSQLLIDNVSTLELIFDLAQWYSGQGDDDTYRFLVRGLQQKWNGTGSTQSLERQTHEDEGPFWQNKAKTLREMATALLEDDHVEDAMIIFEMLDKNAPLDSSLQ